MPEQQRITNIAFLVRAVDVASLKIVYPWVISTRHCQQKVNIVDKGERGNSSSPIEWIDKDDCLSVMTAGEGIQNWIQL